MAAAAFAASARLIATATALFAATATFFAAAAAFAFVVMMPAASAAALIAFDGEVHAPILFAEDDVGEGLLIFYGDGDLNAVDIDDAVGIGGVD